MLAVATQFSLKWCMTDLWPSKFRHLQKLESLEMCGGQVAHVGMAVLSHIPSLTRLSLAYNFGIRDAACSTVSIILQLTEGS